MPHTTVSRKGGDNEGYSINPRHMLLNEIFTGY